MFTIGTPEFQDCESLELDVFFSATEKNTCFLIGLNNIVMKMNAKYFIDKLGLIRHPEGGYFKEIYRSEEIIARESLPKRYDGERNVSTSIFYLLEDDDFSAFHRLKSDEIWHFYAGTSATVYCIDENGILTEIILGDNMDNNESFQVIISKGTWFAARINEPYSFVLMGCTVAPGFNFSDFELGNKEEMLALFPEHENLIPSLT